MPRSSSIHRKTKETDIAPAAYVAEDGLVWHQWEGKALVLCRLDAPV